MEIPDEEIIKDYHTLRQQLNTYTQNMREVINHPNYCLQFLQPGRLVRIKDKDVDFGWGAVVQFKKRAANKNDKDEPERTPQQQYILDVLLLVADDTSVSQNLSNDLPPGVRPPDAATKGKMEVVPVILSCIDSIGHLRVFLPEDLRPLAQRNSVRKALEEVKRRFPDGIAILDPIENMGITDDSFKKLLRVCGDLSCCNLVTNMIRKSRYSSPGFSPTHYTILLGSRSSTSSTRPKWLSQRR
jgi:ATP-dependent RNA helicase DOB1